MVRHLSRIIGIAVEYYRNERSLGKQSFLVPVRCNYYSFTYGYKD